MNNDIGGTLNDIKHKKPPDCPDCPPNPVCPKMECSCPKCPDVKCPENNSPSIGEIVNSIFPGRSMGLTSDGYFPMNALSQSCPITSGIETLDQTVDTTSQSSVTNTQHEEQLKELEVLKKEIAQLKPDGSHSAPPAQGQKGSGAAGKDAIALDLLSTREKELENQIANRPIYTGVGGQPK